MPSAAAQHADQWQNRAVRQRGHDRARPVVRDGRRNRESRLRRQDLRLCAQGLAGGLTSDRWAGSAQIMRLVTGWLLQIGPLWAAR